jgi:hypothetical protein
VTRNPFTRVDVPLSGLVTVTSRKLAVAVPETDIRTVMLVELLRVTELMVMPLPENATPTPVAKLPPLIVMFCGPVPRAFEFGLSDVIVGRDVTVKAFDSVEVPPSGLVTVTLRTPVAAVEDTETLRVNLDEFCRFTVLTVIPVPENATEPPPLTKFDGKFEPFRVMVWFVAP